ncbi:MAG TPA: hypothetical protein VJJ48_00525 [Candidatus Paceibacterota bacterium]
MDWAIIYRAFGVLFHFWPVWLPILLVYLSIVTWLSYKRREWINAQEKVLLEIKIPPDIVKSPLSMEIFLQALHQPFAGNLTEVYFKGRVRIWFSLELVSEGGRVHFYIWTFASARKQVETQLYSVFPDVEIHEVPDYALAIHHDPTKYKFGKFSHIVLTKADAYPIKTYIDYGLDKDPDEEYKNDPIAPVIEFLGSLKPGEHAWIQILLQGHTKEGLNYGRIITKPDWKVAANAEIKKILKEAKFQGEPGKDAPAPKPIALSEGQKDTIKAIERSIDKNAFDSMIRVAYFAEEAVYNAANIGGILGAFKQFGSGNLNGFKPSSFIFEYPWQDFAGIRKTKSEKQMLEAYKRRGIFNEPFDNFHDDKPYILTTEEVATLFHFPSVEAVATPTLTRIPSKKAQAPANLPV